MASRQPMHERIERDLRRRLSVAADGERFPSEISLAGEFDVSRMTVRAALDRIERDGLIDRIPGRGSFVRKPTASRRVGTLVSFHDQARALGYSAGSRLVAAELRTATDAETVALAGGPSGEPHRVVSITRVRLFDRVPIALERATFPEALSALLDRDLEDVSVHRAIRDLGYDPARGTSILSARAAGGDAAHLDVGTDDALLVETRTIVDPRHGPIEFTETAYVPSRYGLEVAFVVDDAAATSRS